jgi:hypothetical protein
MNSRTCYPTIAGSCLAVVAACVFAQAPAPSTTTAPSTSTTGATGTTAESPSQQTTRTGVPAKTPHAKKQHQAKQHQAKQHQAKQHQAKQHQATHTARAKESSVSREDTQYRTALRRCVEGQAAQRDQCLSDAISRYGRS